MGGINVKNTIVEGVLASIAPHLCLNCGKTGSLLCPYCKYDISSEPFLACFVCETPEMSGICSTHSAPIEKAYLVNPRRGAVKDLIEGLKFHNVKAAARVAAELLHERLPYLPKGTVIVPIPTVAGHRRQRGYDQVALIAGWLGRIRDVPVSPLLIRRSKTTQRELNRHERAVAAAQAFGLDARLALKLSKGTPVLLIDDVITTGATVIEAAKVLSAAGFRVAVAGVVFQPLRNDS